MDQNTTSETRSRGWLDDISNHLTLLELPKRATGPLALRRLLGVGGTEMGKLLGGYRRQIVYTWERPERGLPLPRRYAMTAKARESYRRLLVELVHRNSGGRFTARVRLGRRAWQIVIIGHCRQCGRAFHVHRRTDVHCFQHRR